MKANVSSVYDSGPVPDMPQLNAVSAVEKSTPPKSKRRARASSGKWLIAGLLLLSAIPMVAGASRITHLTGGAGATPITPENARFFASPLPVMVHIVSASVFSLLGAFQFSVAFRRRRPGWHRAAGRLIAPAGLLVGLSGLWMTLFYPRPVGDGDLLSAFRLLFGSAMILSIVLGFTAILRRDIRQHRAWMMRGYAIGLGAGTQALILMVGEMIAGPPTELSRALLMGAAWIINLGVAEWGIRRHLRPVRTPSTPVEGRPINRQPGVVPRS